MARKIITAITGMSLFVGAGMAHASAPAASSLKALSGLQAEASSATPGRLAFYGMPGANVATTTNVGISGVAIGTSGAVANAGVANAGGFGNLGVATANAGMFGRGFGGHRRVALIDAPVSSRADILFDN